MQNCVEIVILLWVVMGCKHHRSNQLKLMGRWEWIQHKLGFCSGNMITGRDRVVVFTYSMGMDLRAERDRAFCSQNQSP